MRRTACDVLVAGGGVAGAIAALHAARADATTVLIECEGTLGGIGQAGMLRRVCGLYRNDGETPGELLNPDLVGELVARLGTVPERMGRVWLQPLGGHDLDTLLTGLCREEPRLTVLRGHTVTAAGGDGGALTRVVASSPEGPLEIAPRVAIDATGDGSLARLAGATVESTPPGTGQLAGFTIRLKKLIDPAGDLPLQVPFACTRGVAQGALSPLLRFTTFTRGEAADEGYCKLSVADETPDRDRQTRENAHRLVAYLAATLPGCRDATIVALSPRVLDREGGRIAGEYQLTADDILTARKFPDGVVRGAWPLESWERERGTVYRYGPTGDCYEIPFRALRVRGFQNLLAAGRCLSATREALASTRVIGCCLALGVQAGRAAAHHAARGGYPPEFLA